MIRKGLGQASRFRLGAGCVGRQAGGRRARRSDHWRVRPSPALRPLCKGGKGGSFRLGAAGDNPRLGVPAFVDSFIERGIQRGWPGGEARRTQRVARRGLTPSGPRGEENVYPASAVLRGAVGDTKKAAGDTLMDRTRARIRSRSRSRSRARTRNYFDGCAMPALSSLDRLQAARGRLA